MSLGKSKKAPSPFNKEQGICRDASGAVIPCEEGGLVRKKASPPNEGGGPEEAAENIDMLKGIGHQHGLGTLLGYVAGGIGGALRNLASDFWTAGTPREDAYEGDEHGATNRHPADTIHGKRLQDNRMKRQGRGPIIKGTSLVKPRKSKTQPAKVPKDWSRSSVAPYTGQRKDW